jgi:Do/DeqQ family serine protease
MKNIVKIVLFSALGGIITLSGYKAFFDEPEVKTYIESANQIKGYPASFLANEENSFVLAADKTLNSVVHVKTAVRTAYQSQNPLQFFFGNPNPGSGGGQLRLGTGSGVIISNDGYIVTNNHVIEKAEDILVTLNDGEEFTAKVVGSDPTTDIALLKVDAEDLPYLEFSNSDAVRVGEWVLAVGNPFNLTSTVTAGIISAKGRNIGIINERSAIESFIQTDAAVNPGNSGGALVNTRGELVGINSAISTRTGSFEGYSFAVPSNLAKKVVDDIREYGAVQRAFIGVNIRDLNPRLANEVGIERTNGVYIAGLTESGAAADAGLEKGDIIIAVNKREITKSSELQEIIGGKRPGEEVVLSVIRDNDIENFSVVLRNANGTTKKFKRDELQFATLLGGGFRDISSKEQNVYGLEHGVRVTDVKSGILADQGIPKGYIITYINQKPIKKIEDINKAIQSKPKNHPVVIHGVMPNGREKYFVFNM